MKSSDLDFKSGILSIVGYLYKTLCMTFLLLFLLKFFLNDGSWINYFIIFAVGFCVWLTGHFVQAFILRWKGC
jgi:hypothetical protein